MSSIVGNIPPWLEPAPVDGWPTRALASARLHYALRIPAGWPDEPEERELPTHVEHLVRGPSPADGLLVQFMEGADPAADLTGWAEGPLHMAGAPAVSIALAGGDPLHTLDWRTVEASGSLRDRFGVDDIHLFTGVTRTGPGVLGRVYTMLARRAELAWHIALSLESDCPPGTPFELVERHDHVRAGATLGMVELSR